MNIRRKFTTQIICKNLRYQDLKRRLREAQTEEEKKKILWQLIKFTNGH